MSEGAKPSSPSDVVSGQIPIWMDNSFFQKALREGGEDPQIEVVDSQVEEALGKGENYVSIVYRALVKDGNGKEYHLIVKCLPSNEMRKKFANKGNFFRKEIVMYTTVLPAFEKLKKTKELTLPWAKHYYSFSDRDYDYLVMEDLKKKGFTMRERRKGLDRDHVEAAISALAKYHAHSYAMKVTDPEAFNKFADQYPDTLYGEELKDLYPQIVRNSYEQIAESVRKWGGEKYDRIASKMEDRKDTDFDAIFNLLAPIEPGALLTHGDFWVNNMMFRYGNSTEAETGSGKPLEVKLLDFQIVRYSSPAADLWYFVVTSVDTETRRRYWRDLLENAYLKSFWATLECYGLCDKVPKGLFTMEWLQSEMHRLQRFGFISSVTVTPAVLAQSDDAPDMDSLTEEDIKNPDFEFLKMGKEQLFLARFKALVDDFDENGLFD
ncbi:hypothetical protein J437_LFUL017514 [Ladona fulva]|uniref:CHK kinase-like domain-containing protein n=1 Tax=Ladona fulva TaxID=123851 RepID=A0A8K0P9K8_LADFU|nr:hypothetical protein J437_LFUL017514 [Ladona fulva]